MTEELMKKRLQESLEQEDLRQLKFPFTLDRKERGRSGIPCLSPKLRLDSKALHQKDFLTHKTNPTKA